MLHSRLRGEDKKPDVTKLPAASTGKVDFAKDIQPILARACVSCHGPSKQKGGLRLDCAIECARGGNTGPVFKAGDSLHSRLILAVSGLDDERKMPPKGKALTPAEVGKEKPKGDVAEAAIWVAWQGR